MGRSVCKAGRLPKSACLMVVGMTLAVSTAASAQTTRVFNAAGDTTIRNGSYATVNQDGPIFLTRSSTVPDWERRSLITIDTSTLPPNVPVTSAVLTLTLKSGLGAPNTTRPVTVYRLTAQFYDQEATWMNRRTTIPWQTPGSDIAESYTSVLVTNTPGAKVDFDIKALLQKVVNGDFDSRVTRIALIDVGGGGDVKDSYREYHSSEASNAANRPQLTVTYGTTDPPTGDGVIDVPAGGDLQQALNAVQPGGTVRLASGATYVGNFTLPAKNSTNYILLTTGGVSLPAPGTRIDPSYRPRLATLKSPSFMPALATENGASYYRIVGVAFAANDDPASDVIAVGNSANTSLSQVAHHIELDRILIAGDPAAGQKRGIAANGAHLVIVNSDIRDIKAVGQDSQAIGGWNGPGPVTIRNNYLEGAGENIMFGGAGTNIANLVPSDIVVEDNLLTKNLAWRGSSWTVKNLFELKSARRVLVRRNIMEYNWSAAQAGFAIVLTPRNSGGRNPWSVVEDVEISNNIIRHSGSAFVMAGYDDGAPSGQLARVLVKNNLVDDISSSAWGGGGHFAQVGGEPRDITFDHNTVLHTGNIITFYGGAIFGFVFTNNMIKHNAYGIFGSGKGFDLASLNYYAPGAVVRRNVMAGGSASRYPPDNFFPTVAVFNASFVNMGGHDYRLVAGSPYIGAGTDGLDIGCSFAGLP
jgi:hypothetical protein